MMLVPGVKIILIDDDDGHADLVRVNLERSGLLNEVIHYNNGQKAWQFLSNTLHPDEKFLVLLDLNMPGLDGHQLLTRLKGHEHTRYIPVVVLTTAGDEEEVARCYRLGCNFYMQKPIRYEAFCEAVQELGLFIRKASIPGSSVLMAQGGNA